MLTSHIRGYVHEIFIFFFLPHFDLCLFIQDESFSRQKTVADFLSPFNQKLWSSVLCRWSWGNKGFSRELMFEIFPSCLLIALLNTKQNIKNSFRTHFYKRVVHLSGPDISKRKAVFTCWFCIHGDLISSWI